MQKVTIYSNEYIGIYEDENEYFIESYKLDMPFDELNNIISQNPQIKITDFNVLRAAILKAPMPLQKFGEKKQRISVETSADMLRAFITLFVDQYELENKDGKLAQEILERLKEHNIVFGIKHELIYGKLTNGQRYLVAEGFPPQNGEDSLITMYSPKEIRPRLTTAGNVNFYDVELIDMVEAGGWLGERKDATKGIPGMTITGDTIEPIPGRTLPLLYDKESICEVHEKGITTLHALKGGSVLFKGDTICVSNYLEIDGNVNFKTGNIDFNGFVTIMGTVEDNFFVHAEQDISIEGEYGVGGIKEIHSKNGSVYIRGGVAGKKKAIIRSGNDVYLKYVSDATIICSGAVHIGYYCLNTNITAKEVIFESADSYVIGGKIDAEIKVSASVFGSESETRTNISVRGFNRPELKKRLESIIYEIEAQRGELIKNKFDLDSYPISELSRNQYDEFELKRKQYELTQKSILRLEREKKNIGNYIKVLGDGEIVVRSKAYPNTCISIKGISRETFRLLPATVFYYVDGTIKQKEIDWRG